MESLSFAHTRFGSGVGLGEKCLGLDQVEPQEHLDGLSELGFLGTRQLRQRGQYAFDLMLFLFLYRNDVVVELDRGEGLDEDRRAAGRRAVNDANQLSPTLCFDRKHRAAVSHGNDLILEHLLGVLLFEVGLEDAFKTSAELEETRSQPAELGAGVVLDLAAFRVDGFFDGTSEVPEIGQLAGKREQPRKFRLTILELLANLFGGLGEPAELEERRSGE